MRKARSAPPPAVACNLARAARVGAPNGVWFTPGLTRTMPLQPCLLSTPQRRSCEGGYLSPVTLRILLGWLQG